MKMNLKYILRTLIMRFLKRYPGICSDVLISEGYPAIVDFKTKANPRYGYGNPPHPQLYNIINSCRDIYKHNLESFLRFKEDFAKIPLKPPDSSLTPFWLNDYLPAIDAISLYSFICLFEPRKYVEVGSGNSTKFANRAIQDHKLKTEIISIDPQPRTEINQLCNIIIRKGLEAIDLQIVNELSDGDILFIDGSHRCFMNSDVTIVFLEILPKLKSNVLVHFHDIFLPYDYLPEWEKRYYSEQYLLATALLSETRKFNIILPNYFILNDQELTQIIKPIWNPGMNSKENPGASFWIRTN